MRWHREHELATLNSVLNASRAWRFAIEGVFGSKLGGAAWARGRWSNSRSSTQRSTCATDGPRRSTRPRSTRCSTMSSASSSRARERRSRRRRPSLHPPPRPSRGPTASGRSSDGYLDGRPRKVPPSGVTSEAVSIEQARAGVGWWRQGVQSGGMIRIIQRCPSGSATCAAKAPHSRCEGSETVVPPAARAVS
jgi:hypothetical protein